MSSEGTIAQDVCPVRLKGVGDGLWLTLNPTAPTDTLRQELTKLFKRLNHLAINAKVTIDTGADGDYEHLITELGGFLRDTFKVASVTAPPRRQELPKPQRRQAYDGGNEWYHHRTDMLMLAGRIRSGQKVNSKQHLLVLGDVNPGAEIIAGGDVFVMGRLSGTAAAGQPDNKDAIVLALEFCPTQVQIGDLVAAGLPVGNSNGAEYACVEDGKIIVNEYLKAKPFSSLARPQVR